MFLPVALSGLLFASSAVAAPIFPEARLRIPERVPVAHSVLLTGYDALPEQTDEDPGVTASGVPSYPGVVAARSRDLADLLPFGTIIKITRAPSAPEGVCGFSAVAPLVGYRVIADVTHVRKQNQIDVLFDHEIEVPIGTRSVRPSVALGMCAQTSIEIVGRIPLADVPSTQAELLQKLDRAELARR